VSTLQAPERPRWLEVRRAADRPVLIAGAVAAVLTDLAVRSGVVGLAGSVLVVAVAVGLVAGGRVPNVQSRAMVATAAVFGVCLSVRASPWLLPLDVLAAAGLLVLGASLAAGGSVVDLPFPTLAVRGLHAAAHGAAAPAFVAAAFIRRRPTALLRGIGLAIPLVVVLGLLLGSADAVFAGFFRGWSPVGLIEHAVLLALGAWGMAGLLRTASAEPPPPVPKAPWRVGPAEATVVLGSVVGLFCVFAAAQVVALSGGGRHVLRTAGLTYAEYARSGFFQLLAVASLTLVAIVGLRAVTDLAADADRRRFTVLAEVAIGLTLVIVVVALRRLALYQAAFGLTMLRLYSSVFALWVGVVVVLAGVAIAGVGRRRAWFPAATAGAGLVLLLALNVVNPEAVVARHNVARAARTQRVDPAYLGQLSDDAVPILVDGLARLPEPARTQVLAAVCAGSEPAAGGLWATNASRRQAVVARRRVCAVMR
jgi:hypothetical protein